MNNISVAIILIIVSFGILGLKRGALKRSSNCFGKYFSACPSLFLKRYASKLYDECLACL